MPTPRQMTSLLAMEIPPATRPRLRMLLQDMGYHVLVQTPTGGDMAKANVAVSSK